MDGDQEREKHPGQGKTHTQHNSLEKQHRLLHIITSNMSWGKMQTKPKATSAIFRVWIKKKKERKKMESKAQNQVMIFFI